MKRTCALLGAWLLLALGASAAEPEREGGGNAALLYWMAFGQMRNPPSGGETARLLERVATGEVTWDDGVVGIIQEIARPSPPCIEGRGSRPATGATSTPSWRTHPSRTCLGAGPRPAQPPTGPMVDAARENDRSRGGMAGRRPLFPRRCGRRPVHQRDRRSAKPQRPPSGTGPAPSLGERSTSSGERASRTLWRPSPAPGSTGAWPRGMSPRRSAA